ncbi:1-phosphatidylinositol 3-phosphate 5-kinase-like protein [Emericellopsis cladophorae]|uniref:1-phosphatidylinositol-3-phosphate 5-kinase n=1 Tax=Emericellopsis cladophorae TaxID=2686198 RepID=A0A9P9Y2M8_9HYPO|nr:1-phosphatidylinositol 3-phosphate 5-kinase-like protein [Emericellopsis cladophorae]KAI6782367.1 1-phosphatidylinositol 3-phosphate 5-kinase-like protein [Emericellopsis cladophorae]
MPESPPTKRSSAVPDASGALGSPISFRNRRGSVASVSSTIDKEQLSYALDRIHDTASRAESLTTFNDFAPPPLPTSSTDPKGGPGEIVTQGFSGLYSRFREAVGVGNTPAKKTQDGLEAEADLGGRASRQSGSSASRQDTGQSASPSKLSRHDTITDGASTVSIPEVLDNRSTSSQQSKPNSMSLMTGPKSQASNRQSLPTNATSSVVAHPPVLSKEENGRSRLASQDSTGDSARRSLSRVDLEARLANLDPSLYDTKEGKLPPRAHRDDSSSIASADTTKSPAKMATPPIPSIQTRQLRTPSGSSLLSPDDIPRRPTAISRLSYNRPAGSRDSSTDRGTAAASPVSISANNSVHHDNFSKESNSNKKSAANLSYEGDKFGVSGTLRVCKRCMEVISRRFDASGSEDSGDDHAPVFSRMMGGGRSRSPLAPGRAPVKGKDKEAVIISEGSEDARPITTPMMAIPATRRKRDSTHRSSAILEIDAPQQLSRPGSSRSLKSLASGRPQSSAGHKRHHSKHGFLGRFKPQPEHRAPFRKGIEEEASKKPKLPAFHDDNIIDPELADYMSDESSGDEQMGLFTAMSNADAMSGSFELDRSNTSASLNAGRRHRHRAGEKSISGFSGRGPFDDVNGPASLIGHRKSQRRRNLSNVSGSVHNLPSPRPKSGILKGPTTSTEHPVFLDHQMTHTPQITRSDSLLKRAPKVELNKFSVRHVHRLLHQLLVDDGFREPGPWQKALVPILLQATDDVDPDVTTGEDMDIRHYVKLKRIPGGKPGDTSYVSGVVFTKNVALKSMPRKIDNPRIVLVTFPVEYQRHDQHFMSLQPVIEQEKEFLRVVVQRITNLRPHVLLAEKGVSGVALQYLSEANIAVVYNVKHTVIEAVSRCAETEIVTSLDMLALPVRVGRCANFEVRTFVNNDHPGRKKSYIFLSGCRPDLGCTIALRGTDQSHLGKIKSIVEFMVYVVYNLKLESSLLRDESVEALESGEASLSNSILAEQSFHSASSTSGIGSGGQAAVIDAPSEINQTSQLAAESLSIGERDGQVTGPFGTSVEGQTTVSPEAQDSDLASQVPDDVPMPTYYSDMIAKYETKVLSASPYVKFAQPYLLMKAREQERRLFYLRRLLNHGIEAEEEPVEDDESIPEKAAGEKKAEEPQAADETDQSEKGRANPELETSSAVIPTQRKLGKKGRAQTFQLIRPEMVEKIGQKAPRQMMEILHAVHDAEYDKALFNYRTQTRHWETYIQGNLDLFDPYSHQNIVVLYSVICTDTKIPCTEPGLVAINFYDEQRYDSEMDPDSSLGQYIEDLIYSKDDICTANGCERKMIEHHRTYVHDQSRITVFVERMPDASPKRGHAGDIMIWTYCKVCQKDSEEMMMSDSTFKYSFGKYLELLYWGRGLKMKDSVHCPHDHRRDHIRYFRLGNSRVRIHWDPIDLLEIVVPRARITWKVANDLKLKNDIYTKMEERWNRYMTSVKARLKGIRIDSVLPEKADVCRAEVDRLAKKASEDQPNIVRELQEIYVNTKYYEVVPFNKITRRMLELAGEWDTAFTKFEADFLGDKDMRQLTMLQLKKMFADNESKDSLVSNEGSGSVGDSEEPSQTFTEPDEKSTQPTDCTDNTSMEASAAASTINIEDHVASAEDEKVSIPDEGAIERVDALDLAGSPAAMKDSGSAPRATTENTATQAPAVPVSAPEAPRPSASPQGTDRSVSESPLPTLTLGERVDQKRREQASHPPQLGQSDGVSIPSAPPEGPRTSMERRSSRLSGAAVSPPLTRSVTQPARPLPRSQSSSGKAKVFRDGRTGAADSPPPEQQAEPSMKVDKKLSERLGLAALKNRSKSGQSSIPRLVSKKRESRVSTLAKHFEQLSREFERERIRDRKKRADTMRTPRAMLPRTSTKAIIEVYDDVKEAFGEPAQSAEQVPEKAPDKVARDEAPEPAPATGPVATVGPQEDHPHLGDGASSPKNVKKEEKVEAEQLSTTQPSQGTASDDEAGASDAEPTVSDDFLPGIKEIADSLEPSTEIPLELPKHQRTSLMKYLTNFWAERSASGWPALDYPVTGNDHIFVDSDIIVREDEPSSVIALALNSGDYKDKLTQIRGEAHASAQQEQADAAGSRPSSMSASEKATEILDGTELEKSLLRATGTHLKYQFKDGASVMTCKIFYAEQFDALRRKCGVAERIVESLSRCLKWDSKGGKTKSVFLKTLDDRLILKSLSPVETSAFLRFAPGYFSIMAESLFHDLPSVIAKMVGFFQVLIKNPTTGVDVRLDLLVTENLFYDRSPTRIFDLKGSMRNRKIQSTGEQNEVLLDENMVEFIAESPLFAREHSKKLLRASVWNDTLFLARQNVMDYSLMIAVDEDRKELVVGIIDCIRTYTWDKKLESWIKDRGFAGGGRNRPTVTSPKEYKNRFREAMARYILQSPTCWHLFNYPNYPHYSRARFEDDK